MERSLVSDLKQSEKNVSPRLLPWLIFLKIS